MPEKNPSDESVPLLAEVNNSAVFLTSNFMGEFCHGELKWNFTGESVTRFTVWLAQDSLKGTSSGSETHSLEPCPGVASPFGPPQLPLLTPRDAWYKSKDFNFI